MISGQLNSGLLLHFICKILSYSHFLLSIYQCKGFAIWNWIRHDFDSLMYVSQGILRLGNKKLVMLV